VIKIL